MPRKKNASPLKARYGELKVCVEKIEVRATSRPVVGKWYLEETVVVPNVKNAS